MLSVLTLLTTSTFMQGLLSPDGRFYLVALKQNDVPKIIESMRDMYHLDGKVKRLLISYKQDLTFSLDRFATSGRQRTPLHNTIH